MYQISLFLHHTLYGYHAVSCTVIHGLFNCRPGGCFDSNCECIKHGFLLRASAKYWTLSRMSLFSEDVTKLSSVINFCCALYDTSTVHIINLSHGVIIFQYLLSINRHSECPTRCRIARYENLFDALTYFWFYRYLFIFILYFSNLLHILKVSYLLSDLMLLR